MIKYSILFLFLFSSEVLFSQLTIDNNFNNELLNISASNFIDSKTHITNKNSITNLPFQIGLEFGPAIPLKEKKYFYNGWWIYGNVNLYSKRIFLRFAYGNLKLNEGLGGTAPYIQIGASAIPFVYKQHSVCFNLGICLYTLNKHAGIVTFSAGLNYLYRFNQYVSVTAGIQMPVIRKSHYNEYFQNPFLTVGVLFF